MKILLSGVQTTNKGAELMLYSILQEIERKFPDAKVYLSPFRIKQGVEYIKTNVDFRLLPFEKLVSKFKLKKIFKIFHLPYSFLPHTYVLRDVNYYLDGSGFAYSDQFNITESRIYNEKALLEFLSKHGCKNVFLPQAFGPVEKTLTKMMLSVISENASIIMPREKVSYKYLEDSGNVDMNKVKLFTDFTSLVEGIFPQEYEHLRNGICLIPNNKMIEKGVMKYDEYIYMLTSIVNEVKMSGHQVYLLNHEGNKDEELAYKCQQSIGDGVEVVTGLNALEVKGLIASAYLVVTSRFHGLASSLNSCVPALATSWSHKYEELYRDYGMEGYILPIGSENKALEKIKELLDANENKRIRKHLESQVPKVKEQTREMWDVIWSTDLK